MTLFHLLMIMMVIIKRRGRNMLSSHETLNRTFTLKELCHEIYQNLTLSLPESLMEFCKVTLTFEYAHEILRCDHSNESSLSVLSHDAICFSKF